MSDESSVEAAIGACVVCGMAMQGVDPGEGCYQCRERYPASLIKACGDPFDYAVGLVTGEVIRFVSAEIVGEWVTLNSPIENSGLNCGKRLLPYECPRGIDVRLSSIVWCADAPAGS